MSVQVPKGYKQTEVGVIPEDWDVYSLGKLSEFVTSGSRGWAKYYSRSGPLFIRSQNIRDGHLDLTDRQCVVPPVGAEGSRTRINFSDLLITITGNNVGNVAWVQNELGEAYISQHVGLVRLLDSSSACYICYFLAPGSFGNDQIVAGQTGQSKPGLNLKNLENFLVALPSSNKEKKAIAEALSDADALIESLEQLIAKKRQIKQGAMQDLLTGQRRLPGFSGEWKRKKLGDICDIRMGRTPSRLNPHYWGAGHKWLSISDLKAKYIFESNEEITSLAACEMQVIPKGSLLMSFKLSLGRLAFAGCDLYTNEAICSFQGLNANAQFLYYILGRTDFSLYGKQAVKGYTLNKESLKTIEILMPPLDEQNAIAEVLSSIDCEIDELNLRLNKVRQIKQSMMQELLTGRIRLI